MKRVAYIIWQVLWGFPQTCVGLVVLAAHARERHFVYYGALVTVWKIRAGLSLGPFVFLNEFEDIGIDERLLVHEYGHTIQSLILGPLYLIVIGIPSLLWMKTPAFRRRRHVQERSYYSFYTERWANYLGERVLGRPSMGQALID